MQDDTTVEYYFYGTGVEADAQLDIYAKTGGVKRTHREIETPHCMLFVGTPLSP